jgi:hypothetical protein
MQTYKGLCHRCCIENGFQWGDKVKKEVNEMYNRCDVSGEVVKCSKRASPNFEQCSFSQPAPDGYCKFERVTSCACAEAIKDAIANQTKKTFIGTYSMDTQFLEGKEKISEICFQSVQTAKGAFEDLNSVLNNEMERIKRAESELEQVTKNRNSIMNSLLSCREELEGLKSAHDFLSSEHCALENKAKAMLDDLKTLSESPCENHQGGWFSHHMSYGWDCKCKTCIIARNIIFAK